ncbi:L-seryl-tRNA(Sec) selenium transferase [candidate division KSB1 bacterium]|nr:L-seryl-tRNA(Sec) selenium transferase [candidate division KSB1 bacterium]
MTNRQRLLMQIPKVDKIVDHPLIKPYFDHHPRNLIMHIVREELATLRHEIQTLDAADQKRYEELSHYDFASHLNRTLAQRLRPNIRRCINAAGIILHTGLGRAPLSAAAQKAIMNVSRGYANIELILDSGKRGNRHDIVQGLLTQITGAEAAAVVNNNAAATFLTLNTLTCGKECIVSRGELVTIGGSFRIPVIMEKSGSIMAEVGTTNHTWLKDYEQAINENTGILMKVHRSNFRINGFTAEVSLADLIGLGAKYNIPVVHDLGSGSLIDLSRFGLPKEPVVRESVEAGADIVMFSGDKLLGGPQAGIIVGKKIYIDRIKSNQLARPLRCGKLTFAALEATLRMFLDEDRLLAEHPVLRMLTEDLAIVRKRAQKLERKLKKILKGRGDVHVEEGKTEIGGGSLATETLPTCVVAVSLHGFTEDETSRLLRSGEPPVISRIENDQVLLDMRTVRDEEVSDIAKAFSGIIE